MRAITPKRVAILGGALIVLSGVANVVLGIRIGALVYEVYPGGAFGHVGVVGGIAAVALGSLVLIVAILLYERDRRSRIIGGALTILFGHAGAIGGAIYIGTVGMILCYGAALWLFATRWRDP